MIALAIIFAACLALSITIKMRVDKLPFRCAAGWHADTRDVVKIVITPTYTRTFIRCTCKRCGRVDVEEDGWPWVR